MVNLGLNVEKSFIECKGCKDCIFSRIYEKSEYGELTCKIDFYCACIREVEDGIILEDESAYELAEIEDDFRLKNCPIISITEVE